MNAKAIGLVLLLVGVVLAGCSSSDDADGDDGPAAGSGRVHFTVTDDAPMPVGIHVTSAWLGNDIDGELIGTGFVSGNHSLELSGSGEDQQLFGDVPAGNYTRIIIAFEGVDVNGAPAAMVQSGIQFDLRAEEKQVVIDDGSDVDIRVSFLWDDAVFEAQGGGTAFDPNFMSLLQITVDGVEAFALSDEGLQRVAGAPPVARMRIFEEATGFQVFESDFIADHSLELRAIATAGTLLFSGTPSETIAPDATIASYHWDFGDGNQVTTTNTTVAHTYGIAGGNVTVTLTVTDSTGAEDDQRVSLVLAPSRLSRSESMKGTTTGLGGYTDESSLDGTSIDQGHREHMWTMNTTSLDGSEAQLVELVVTLNLLTADIGVLQDLNLVVFDADGGQVGASNTARVSDEVVEASYSIGSPPPSGNWTARVVAQTAYNAQYVVSVSMTYEGINPAIQTWLLEYDDGHQHQH